MNWYTQEWLDTRFGYGDYLRLNRKWKLIYFESVAKEILEMLQAAETIGYNQEDRIGTNHIWIDGPDGHGYHCPICGISKCDDHNGYRTCEQWIVHRAECLKDRTYPLFDVTRRLWEEYLNRRIS